MENPLDLTTLTSQFPTVPSPSQGTIPIGSPMVYRDTLDHEDRVTIEQIAADLLDDPMALQYLCDHVYALMQQDLSAQHTR